MTSAQLHDLFALNLDEAHHLYWRPFEVYGFLNQARSKWMDELSPLFETTEGLRRQFPQLVRAYEYAGGTEVTVSAPAFQRIIRVEGQGGTDWPTTFWRKLDPASRNREEDENDAFNVATNRFPKYEERGGQSGTILDILAESPPNRIRVEVITLPPLFDESKPDFDWNAYVPENVQLLWVNKALAKAGVPAENQLQIQAGLSEKIQTV